MDTLVYSTQKELHFQDSWLFLIRSHRFNLWWRNRSNEYNERHGNWQGSSNVPLSDSQIL